MPSGNSSATKLARSYAKAFTPIKGSAAAKRQKSAAKPNESRASLKMTLLPEQGPELLKNVPVAMLGLSEQP